MNTPHTPEHWGKKILPAYCSTSMMFYFTININDQPRIKVYNKVAIEASATANQIVACVNACAGMVDPAKEIAELRAEIARLKNPPTTPTCDELDYDSRS